MDEAANQSTSLSMEEVRTIKVAASNSRAYSDRISFQLAVRLLGFLGSQLDVSSVFDELDYLEGICPVSRTKPAAMFKKTPLAPLWHKHFFTARHTMKNIGIRWGMDNGGNAALLGMIEGIAKKYGDNPEMWQMQLAHQFTIGAFEERLCWRDNFPDGNLTGDWIIFCKHEGKNYYLDVANHAEGKKPKALIEKLQRGCAFEFPFAFPEQ